MFSKSYFILCLLVIIASCNFENPAKAEYVITTLDSTITPTKIPIKELAKNYKSLHGQYIETAGIFYAEFENVSICGDGSNCFWLDYNDTLIKNYDSLRKISIRKIIIKGLIDTSRKGHMGSYLATISNIYYLKEK